MKYKLEVLLSPDEVQNALTNAALEKVDLGSPWSPENAKAVVIDRGMGVFVATVTLEIK